MRDDKMEAQICELVFSMFMVKFQTFSSLKSQR